MREEGVDEIGGVQAGLQLFKLVNREAVTLTIFGHDENLWPTLKKAPAFYD
ncbi:hypothetical protein KSD_90950 [Ktedonobacter sp. SOSP1-85]|nr:hypothetical protein KSD_90950 [Ktedonobacter sp. SOSP1-85]